MTGGKLLCFCLVMDIVLISSKKDLASLNMRERLLESYEFEKTGQDIIIGITSLQGCSLRAEDGTFSTEEISTKNNKLNLNVPLRNAVNGKGYIISQYKKGRAVYQFDIKSVIENDEDHALILTDGTLKLTGQEKIQETSTVYLDKVNMVVNVDGETFDLNEMPIYFMQRC